MPKRTDVKNILIIGAGPIVIGQACEFDYSGTQGIKALKEEGYRVVLINSNPATIMTDSSLADKIYIEPITPECIEQILKEEAKNGNKIDAILPTLGGQTALNTALKLADAKYIKNEELYKDIKNTGKSILEEYNVSLIGVNVEAIQKAEDRGLFKRAMEEIGLKTPESIIVESFEHGFDNLLWITCGAAFSNIVTDSTFKSNNIQNQLKQMIKVLDLLSEEECQIYSLYIKKLEENDISFFEEQRKELNNKRNNIPDSQSYLFLPVIIRPSLTLGGTGGGVAETLEDYIRLVKSGLDASPIGQIQIDKSIIGWKEFEMEVVRDKKDNAIIICSIENVDPMGVHTGDSITVAPALTLTDKEYQTMRDASIAVLRKIGVETGGSNVQFAVNPKDGEMVVIEMNPRVSRSSALASKATGFPIAKVAAKLAVGYTLDELKNDIACALPKHINYLEYRKVLLEMTSTCKDVSTINTNKDILEYIEGEFKKGSSIFDLNQRALPASFEPSIDYVVVKIPKFNFEKFNTQNPELGTQMQSVGEVMALGRSFEEAFLKAVAGMEEPAIDFNSMRLAGYNIFTDLRVRDPKRIYYIMEAFRMLIESFRPNTNNGEKVMEDKFEKLIESISSVFTDYQNANLEDDDYCQYLEAAIGYPEKIEEIVIQKDKFVNYYIGRIAIITGYDKWFLERLYNIVEIEEEVLSTKIPLNIRKQVEEFTCLKHKTQDAVREEMNGKYKNLFLELSKTLTKELIFKWKKFGLRDLRIRELLNLPKGEVGVHLFKEYRKFLGVVPIFKKIDSCAGEFASTTNYFYSCYELGEQKTMDDFNMGQNESTPSTNKKVVVIGSGPNRVGQGIEFDYSCVHACFALKEMGIESIMINSNPETVSTDYDTSDKLFFEPLIDEHVMNVIENEMQNGVLLGVIIQLGGQTPLKLRQTLKASGIPILGMKKDAIDICDDRAKFSSLVKEVGAKEMQSFAYTNKEDVLNIAKNLGYKFIIRPSAVIGGRGIAIIETEEELSYYLSNQKELSGGIINPLLKNAIELDVDLLRDKFGNIFIFGMLEHIEFVGVHSGDSSCSIQTRSLSEDIKKQIERLACDFANKLEVEGLINMQVAVKNTDIFIIEVNPRASRTVPFTAKSIGFAAIKTAVKLMCGANLLEDEDFKNFSLKRKVENYYIVEKLGFVSIKEPVFSFEKFLQADIIRGPEMKSLGEVMGIDKTFGTAFAKALIGGGQKFKLSGTAFISVKEEDKTQELLCICKDLINCGFKLIATKGTAEFLLNNSVTCQTVNKVYEGGEHIVNLINDGKVDFVLNTTSGVKSIADSFLIRRSILKNKIFHSITIEGCVAIVKAIQDVKEGQLSIYTM